MVIYPTLYHAWHIDSALTWISHMTHTCQGQGFALEKSYLFSYDLGWRWFYIKIITLDKIYNFSSFEFLSFAISLHAQKTLLQETYPRLAKRVNRGGFCNRLGLKATVNRGLNCGLKVTVNRGLNRGGWLPASVNQLTEAVREPPRLSQNDRRG